MRALSRVPCVVCHLSMNTSGWQQKVELETAEYRYEPCRLTMMTQTRKRPKYIEIYAQSAEWQEQRNARGKGNANQMERAHPML
jgi:hypothetical protein